MRISLTLAQPAQMTQSASPEPSQPAEPRNFIDQLFYYGFVIGGVVLCCQLGMLFAALDLPPYRMTTDALSALRALQDQSAMRGHRWPKELWEPAPQGERGLLVHQTDKVQDGLTLFSTGEGCSVQLLDLDGTLVHKWQTKFQEVWSGASHVDAQLPEHFVYIRRTHLYPNGDLLVQYETPLTTPNGIGLAKLDQESQLLWRLDRNCHHDIDVGEDGTIYALSHWIRSTPHPVLGIFRPPFIEDGISVISPEGEEIKTFSLFDVLVKSNLCRPRTFNEYYNGDSFHSNTVHLISAEFAAHYDGVEAGDLMVCLRNLNLVVAINLEREEIVWGSTGAWHHPHDPDPLPNGNILIFDNYFARGAVSGSRVIEFDPRDGSIDWEFAATPTRDFKSDVRACQQKLANGNVLITESGYGRLTEVTPAGEVVWQYVNPTPGGDDGQLVPITLGAQRLSRDIPFLNN